MTTPTEPDPIVVALGEIRDELRKINAALAPKEVRMAEAMRPTPAEPRKRPTVQDIIG